MKNFSKTAELLGYSQSAVTVQIRQLETELGVRLFACIKNSFPFVVSITFFPVRSNNRTPNSVSN